MAGYFIFNEIDSREMGVLVNKVPRLSRPDERVNKITIPGRDGSVFFQTGKYEDYETTAEITVRDPDRRNSVLRWLSGPGKLITSFYPDHYVNARITNRIDPERIFPKVDQMIITFTIQPFLYQRYERPEVFTLPGTIFNPGSWESLPIITVKGNGGIYLGNQIFSILPHPYPEITINSVIQEAYYQNNLANNYMGGYFPAIQPGLNSVSWYGSITEVKIQGNWRWL